jgi:hypothetical protein
MCVICGTNLVMGFANCTRGTALVNFYKKDFDKIRSDKGIEFCKMCAHLSDDDFNAVKKETLIKEFQSLKLLLKKCVFVSSIIYSLVPVDIAPICLEYLGDEM